jgi:SAM-dependent methyltransferase
LDKSFLVKLFGFPATLIHGDTMTRDRWVWLRRRLPKTENGEKLIDIGCGTGAFTIGAARRGYHALGLSWDQRNQNEARRRAEICKADQAQFEVQDVRNLDQRADLAGQFDIAICLDTVEHIMDDFKLFAEIARCLKPGGRLLLTTPNYYFRPLTRADLGPWSKTEDGGHVRRGYTRAMLNELCESAGLVIERFSGCSGFLSQKVTGLLWSITPTSPMLGWLVILPLRFAIIPFDAAVTWLLNWPRFSICIEAYKPRRSSSALTNSI